MLGLCPLLLTAYYADAYELRQHAGQPPTPRPTRVKFIKQQHQQQQQQQRGRFWPQRPSTHSAHSDQLPLLSVSAVKTI
jgi:hypothetical protein